MGGRLFDLQPPHRYAQVYPLHRPRRQLARWLKGSPFEYYPILTSDGMHRQEGTVRRREFITLIGGAAAWPLAVGAQQPETIRRIGVLMGGSSDSVYAARVEAFRRKLHQLGWVEGGNVEIDVRWGDNDRERVVAYARELVRRGPDVIVAGPSNAVAAIKQETRNIPIVFVQVSDRRVRGLSRASRAQAATSPASAISSSR
jgi:phosphoribosylcarboxyaminoimidazole (NCAIR) mutase